jgi:hypothetical protein
MGRGLGSLFSGAVEALVVASGGSEVLRIPRMIFLDHLEERTIYEA